MNDNAAALLDVTGLSQRCTPSGMVPVHVLVRPGQADPDPDGPIAFGAIKRSHTLHEKPLGFAAGTAS